MLANITLEPKSWLTNELHIIHVQGVAHILVAVVLAAALFY